MDTTELRTESDMETTPDACKLKLPYVPFVYDYLGGEYFFERPCYGEYYALVERLLLSGERCVTVTGTPGIGKSVFYAYFTSRYMAGQTDTWVIATAYMGNTPTEVAIFRDDGEPPAIFYDDVLSRTAISTAVVNATAARKRVLFLSNGSPPAIRKDGQNVVFTNPNQTWLGMVWTMSCTYYMPLWTRDELQTAARVLGLGLADADLDDRFHKFGGIARLCLHPDPAFVAQEGLKLRNAMAQIVCLRQLQTAVGEGTGYTGRSLLHYEPRENDCRLTTDQLASTFVEEMLATQVLRWDAQERRWTRSWLRVVEHGGALRGRIFEGETHRVLCRGRRLRLCPLGSAVSADTATEIVDIEPTGDTPAVFKELEPSMATRGPYNKPEVGNSQSIASFYLPKIVPTRSSEQVTEAKVAEWIKLPGHRLLLFHITVSLTHDVDGAGLVHAIKCLGLQETVALDTSLVALVFVVPQEEVRSFKRQKITPASSDEVGQVCGGGEQAVSSSMIETIQDMLVKIPQYVCSWDEHTISVCRSLPTRVRTRAASLWTSAGTSGRSTLSSRA